MSLHYSQKLVVLVRTCFSFHHFNHISNMDPIYFKPNVSDEPIRKPPENIKIFKKERHMEGKFAKMSENFGIPRKLLLFSGNSGRCCSILHWKFPEIHKFFIEWKAPSISKLLYLRCELKNRLYILQVLLIYLLKVSRRSLTHSCPLRLSGM